MDLVPDKILICIISLERTSIGMRVFANHKVALEFDDISYPGKAVQAGGTRTTCTSWCDLDEWIGTACFLDFQNAIKLLAKVYKYVTLYSQLEIYLHYFQNSQSSQGQHIGCFSGKKQLEKSAKTSLPPLCRIRPVIMYEMKI